MSEPVLGFHVSFDIQEELSIEQRNELLGRFITNAIEVNALQFGGGGTTGWAGYVEPLRIENPITKLKRLSVLEHFKELSLVVSAVFEVVSAFGFGEEVED